MADRHLEAAAETLRTNGLFEIVQGEDGPFAVMRDEGDLAREAVTAYLDSLLGELPYEVKRAAEEAVAYEMEPIADGDEMVPGLYAEVANRALLKSLRDSLASGTGGTA